MQSIFGNKRRLCQHLEKLFSIGEIEYSQSERLDRTHFGRVHVAQIVHFQWTNENSRWITKHGDDTTASGNNSSSYVNLLKYDFWSC